MSDEGKRWLAPSATPWDGKDEASLNPAEAIVMACHRDIYGYRHANGSLEGEAEFFNGYPRDACPLCGSGRIRGNGCDRHGVSRWRCNSCGKSFTPMTGTIFQGHKLPVADWTEFLIETFAYESVRGMTRSNRRSDTTLPYWMAKLFAVLEGVQDDVMLSGTVQIDEKYYPVAAKDRVLRADGKQPRGLSRNQACIAVGCDSSKTPYVARMGLGKPSKARTWNAYGGHIERGSRLVHDMEGSHDVLVEKLGLGSERHNSKLIKQLPDKENPLREVNRLCYHLELFLNSHSGFDRGDLDGWLNLFWVIMAKPADKMEKAAMVLDRAMRCPKTLSFRDFYKLHTRSEGL